MSVEQLLIFVGVIVFFLATVRLVVARAGQQLARAYLAAPADDDDRLDRTSVAYSCWAATTAGRRSTRTPARFAAWAAQQARR